MQRNTVEDTIKKVPLTAVVQVCDARNLVVPQIVKMNFNFKIVIAQAARLSLATGLHPLVSKTALHVFECLRLPLAHTRLMSLMQKPVSLVFILKAYCYNVCFFKTGFLLAAISNADERIATQQ
jgi:hypothetical protein